MTYDYIFKGLHVLLGILQLFTQTTLPDSGLLNTMGNNKS